MMPICYLGFKVTIDNLSNINNRKLELNGLQYQEYVRPLLVLIAQHRGMTAGYFGGKEEFKPKIEAVAETVDEKIAELSKHNENWQSKFETNQLIEEIIADWNTQKTENFTQRKKENFDNHSALISKVLFLLDHVGVKSRLSLDPDADVSYLVNLATNKLPTLKEEIGKLRGVTAGLASRGYLEDGENLTVARYKLDVLRTLDSLKIIFVRLFEASTESAEKYQEDFNILEERVNIVVANSDKLLTDITALMNADSAVYFQAGTDAITQGNVINDTVKKEIQDTLTYRIDEMQSSLYITAAISFALLMFAMFLIIAISRDLKLNFKNIISLFEKIENEQYENEITVEGSIEFRRLFENLEKMQTSLRESTKKDREQSEKFRCINLALDKVSAGVMMADEDLNIVYSNDAAVDILSKAESDIRKELPDFDAKNLLGVNIDGFHKDPSHQRELLKKLSKTFQSDIKIGSRTLRIIANPVFNDQKVKIGTVVEWFDRTEGLLVEDEVNNLVNSALKGDLSNRIDLSGKEGFLKLLSEGMNDLVEISEGVINDTVRVLSALSQGNLSEKIDKDYQGSYEHLKNDANAVVEKLQEVVANIKDSADTVSHASKEISEGNHNLSQRTEQQAASLEETSSSMEEMTSTVQQNADNAQQANQLAIDARQQAENGGTVVATAVAAMNEINSSSKKIADITSVIDEIAFQTNLLALNASVEAARAGEQGRGFAVVASEVRNLAGRSATAAKEIKELIEDSVSKVDEGSKLVNKSGETLNEIVTSVKKVTDIIGEISASSQEQASGIDEVNRAILRMDEGTQQNAALVEEAAAASQSMRQEADELTKQMSFFVVDDEDMDTSIQVQETVQVERRSADRPWSQTNQGQESTQPEAPVEMQKASGSDFDDDEWAEF